MRIRFLPKDNNYCFPKPIDLSMIAGKTVRARKTWNEYEAWVSRKELIRIGAKGIHIDVGDCIFFIHNNEYEVVSK